MTTLKNLFLAATLLFGANAVLADDELIKPFVLGSKGSGTVAEKAAAARTALAANGFTVAGEYSPYPDADVIVVTSDELKSNAAQSEHGGFGAIQRVSVTKVKNEIQVSYTNPAYMANVYRMKGDLKGVRTKLQAALGSAEDFGAQGITVSKARKYHYMMGMEYFDEPSLLASYGSYDQAVAAVEKGLASGTGGVSKVYRVDVPGKQESVFGVGLKGASDAQKYMDDRFIMSEIDFRDIKSTAHLPYEVLVSGKDIYALYARFRIAIDFPDLSMMGSNSFMNIMSTPEAIRKALQQAVSQ
ncbi:MAG: hypothetical protein HY306_03600 [Nitrosomonadales bacterium]|nr:hypothetical protein [Nitrosomonadales bacterium]